jgi:peptidoglycan/xylan/chitin deacetylase (PgdA/CDA1 family)
MIGLHGARHSSMFLRSTASVVDELNTLAHTIAARTRRPLDTLRWFRPPWGHLRPDQLRGLRAAGYHVVMASLLPGDWNSGAATVVRRVHRQIHDGALIALHDGRFAGRNCEQIAAQLLPILLDRGYRFVTVDELMAAQS